MSPDFEWYIVSPVPRGVRLYEDKASTYSTPDYVEERYEHDAPKDALIVWRLTAGGLFGLAQGNNRVCLDVSELERLVLRSYSERGSHKSNGLAAVLRNKDTREQLLTGDSSSDALMALERVFSVLRRWYPEKIEYEEIRD